MYRYSNGQISLADFKQPVGMNLKESNRWVKKAQTIPWPEIEKRYAALFTNRKVNVANARRMGSVFPARLWGGPRRVKPETRLRTIRMSASAWKWRADSVWRSVNVAWGWSLQSCGRLRPM